MGAIAAAGIGMLGGIGALSGYGFAEAQVPTRHEISAAEQTLQQARDNFDSLTSPESCYRAVTKTLSSFALKTAIDEDTIRDNFVHACGDSSRSNDDRFIADVDNGLQNVAQQHKEVRTLKINAESAGLLKALGGFIGGFGGLVTIPVMVTIHQRRRPTFN